MNREEKQLSGGARKNKAKTHCQHGHRFTTENIYRTRNGWRICRECKRQGHQKWNLKQKQVTQKQLIEIRHDLAALKREFRALRELWSR